MSPAFIASDFIYTEELSRLLERRSREGIRVVPIILRPCAWKHEKPIESLQARPKNGKAIVTFTTTTASRDQAWSDIVDDCRERIERGSGFLAEPSCCRWDSSRAGTGTVSGRSLFHLHPAPERDVPLNVLAADFGSG